MPFVHSKEDMVSVRLPVPVNECGLCLFFDPSGRGMASVSISPSEGGVTSLAFSPRRRHGLCVPFGPNKGVMTSVSFSSREAVVASVCQPLLSLTLLPL